MKKSKLKQILKSTTEEKTLEELEKKKAKIMNITQKELKMQKYLKSNGVKMNQEDNIQNEK